MLGNMIRRLIGQVPPPSKDDIRKEVECRNRDAGAMVAARYTRGNVAIQRGKMTLEETHSSAPPREPAEQ